VKGKRTPILPDGFVSVQLYVSTEASQITSISFHS
jgi:hypothetical protein